MFYLVRSCLFKIIYNLCDALSCIGQNIGHTLDAASYVFIHEKGILRDDLSTTYFLYVT